MSKKTEQQRKADLDYLRAMAAEDDKGKVFKLAVLAACQLLEQQPLCDDSPVSDDDDLPPAA